MPETAGYAFEFQGEFFRVHAVNQYRNAFEVALAAVLE
jgi:hypothetical protein